MYVNTPDGVGRVISHMGSGVVLVRLEGGQKLMYLESEVFEVKSKKVPVRLPPPPGKTPLRELHAPVRSKPMELQ